MKQEEIINKINELEKEVSLLPTGSIALKRINGKDYYYHRININGKRNEEYVSFENLDELKSQIEKRKGLENKLKDLKKQVVIKSNMNKKNINFKTIVCFGDLLKSQVSFTEKYKKRECIKKLREYIFSNENDKVFILYGLRRTGKTTLIRQMILELSIEDFEKTAFIQIQSKDTFSDINNDLRLLGKNGFKYIFIDEVTLLKDFVEGSAIFADIYASSGMKIVLSGTDSLGFLFSKEEQLYDRCIMLHTTFIPYREFEEVLGIKGIDEYIRYGGTMSLSGINYNADSIFSNLDSANEYIDTAIAKNIQHSLKMYEYGGHFRSLLDLYEKNELTNVINRVVENINHRFTRQVIEKTFKSSDISLTARNLLNDRDNPIDIKEHINLEKLTKGIMDMLSILNKEEKSIDIEDCHLVQIKEYLTLLDLIMEIDLESLPEVNKKNTMTVISQPGLRYAQASAIVENLLLDEKFKELSINDRQRILERLLSEIRGRMMEEIVLLETKIAKPDKKIFKLQFAVGEFDMVVFDPKTLTCEIYEIKYSQKQVKDQYRHLIDEDKCALTTYRYGEITGRYVIYKGDSIKIDNIQYLNVEEYLKSL